MENLVTVVVIDSRSKEHPDWVENCKETILNQTVRCQLIMVDNTDKDKTIGYCWNEAVKQAEGNWIFFVGDDDWVARDVVQVMLGHIKEGLPCVTTYMTWFNEEGYKIRAVPCTGMWRKNYLLKYPFNETLNQGIDREYFQEALKRGDNYILVPYYFGHYARRHDENITGKKLLVVPEKTDIYVTSSGGVNFITPLVKEWSKNKKVFLGNQPFDPNIKADIIWCEWANENAVRVADFKTDAKKILRLHSYEAFDKWIYYIDFKKFDKVIFIADHIKEFVESKIGKLDNAVVIPVGIDVDKFTIGEIKNVKYVAYAGQISRKKGVGELILIANSFPDYEFFVAGKFAEDDVARVFNENIPENIHLEPYSYNLNEFFRNKSFIINTSLREGNPITVLEGMSAGLFPVVNSWIGAEDIFNGYTYKNFNQLNILLHSEPKPSKYREFVKNNYNFENTLEKINVNIFS